MAGVTFLDDLYWAPDLDRVPPLAPVGHLSGFQNHQEHLTGQPAGIGNGSVNYTLKNRQKFDCTIAILTFFTPSCGPDLWQPSSTVA